MNKVNSLAYPYANAIFEIAKRNNNIDKWSNYLSIMSEASKLEGFKLAVSNPLLSTKSILNLLLENVGKGDDDLKRFLDLLVKNNRLDLFESIFYTYKKIMENYNNQDSAIIETAFMIDDKDKKELETILTKKFGKNVSAIIKLNPDLIGGIKIILDDIVIDSSVKGNINKMFSQLLNRSN
jgi:F-type H+-transporting ATPase subunit delta